MAAPAGAAGDHRPQESHARVDDGLLAPPPQTPQVRDEDCRRHDEEDEGKGPGKAHQTSRPDRPRDNSAPMSISPMATAQNRAVISVCSETSLKWRPTALEMAGSAPGSVTA